MGTEKEFDPNRVMTMRAERLIKIASHAAQVERHIGELLTEILETCEENDE